MSFKVNIETISKYSPGNADSTAYADFSRISGGNVVGHHTPNLSDDFTARSEKPFLRACLQNAPEAYIVTTVSGTIQIFNRRAEALFGYSEEEIRGWKISTLIEPGVQPNVAARDIKHDASGWPLIAQNGELKARKKNGELFPADIRRNQCTLASGIVHIYYIRDISVAQRYEQRIAELEREIAYLSRHSVLGELATSITHELSQPLTAITNYTAAALRCGSKASPEELETSLEMIGKAGEQAKRAWLIMHRLRQLLQHRGAERSREDLRLAVDDAVHLATLGTVQQGIAVSVEVPAEPVMVLMDRIQIQVLMANLIRNAVDELRCSDGERKIWIRLAVNKQNMAEFSVEDTGPGIAPEVFENIFDPFHTTKAEGLGVGLALSRRIAQVHGGRLAADNSPEGGAIFSFVIPVSMSEKQDEQIITGADFRR